LKKGQKTMDKYYLDRDALFEEINSRLRMSAVGGTIESRISNTELLALLSRFPTADVVSRKAFEHVMWERDAAIQSLMEICIGPDGKTLIDPTEHSSELIKRYIPEAEILAQLAEECAELGKAALKLRRTIDKTNPTPVSENEAKEQLIEEISDVVCCLRELGMLANEDIITQKKKRWIARLTSR